MPQPLTKEQFFKARQAGFTTDQIIEFEKKRLGKIPQATPQPQQPPTSFLRKLYSEAVSPIVAGSSTLAFGIPRAVAKETGTEELIYPEQETIPGKALRFGAEAAGLLGGGAAKGAKLAIKSAEKIIPKLTGKGLTKTIVKGVVGGGAFGLLQTPEEGKGILKPEERFRQAKTFGAIGGALPIAGAALKRAAEVITKTGRWAVKTSGVTDATIDTIKRLGAKRVFDPAKAKADYITQDLVPRVQEKINQAIQNFTSNIQKFAQEKLKIPESAISTIRNKGVNTINKIRQAYADSTDAISQKISQGFVGMRELAERKYQDAVNSFKGNAINSQPFYQSIQRGLRQKGWIDLRGNPTTRYKGGLDPVADKLTDLYLDMRSGGFTAKGKRIIGRIISKEDFYTYRDALNSMLKEKPSDRLVMQAKNALYHSAEKSGMTGLKAARDLEKRVFDMEEKFLDAQGNLKALGKEGTLDKFHKLTQDKIRQLREIEEYTGEKFVDDLDALTAGKYLDEFTRISPKSIASDLIKARNPNWTKYIKNQYDELLGERNFRDLYNDLMAHFANIEFELVAETPGVGGSSYPSRGRILKDIVSKGAKTYYGTIAPKKKMLESKIEEILKRLPETPKYYLLQKKVENEE